MRFKGRRRPQREKLRVATHFPSLRTYDGQDPNVFMFVQDVHLAVMPMRAVIREGSKYKVEISGDAGEASRTTALLESLTKHDRYNLEELVSEAIGEVVRDLAWHGQAVHEIVRDSDDESIYLLHAFTTQRLFHAFRHFVQVVPKEDRDLWQKTIIVLPEKDVWAVSVPESLGGYNGYRALLRKLKKFQNSGPTFWRKSLEQQERDLYFDFQRYTRETEIFHSRATQRWGWNRRDFSDRYWTEFMQVYRSLTFKWAQAELREHIIAEFNTLLGRLGIAAQVKVAGVPSAADLLRARNDMSAGTLSFNQAYDVTEL